LRFFGSDGVRLLEVKAPVQQGTVAASFGDGVSLGSIPLAGKSWRVTKSSGSWRRQLEVISLFSRPRRGRVGLH